MIMEELGGDLSNSKEDRELLLKLKANGGKKSKPKKTKIGNYKPIYITKLRFYIEYFVFIL
jgi:hypothetical protein